MKTIFGIAVVMLFAAGSAQSQSNYWRITLLNDSVVVGLQLEKLSGDTLFVSSDSMIEGAPVDSIVEIRLVKTSTFWSGAKIGATVGFVTGLFGGAIFSKPGGGPGTYSLANPWIYKPLASIFTGIGLGFVGYLVGGIVGAILGIDEVYDLYHVTHAGKLTIIARIISEKR